LNVGVLEGEIWVCADCRSINNARAKQCYNCRTPRDLAAVDPAMIEGTGHGKLRDVGLPAFHSPRPYAFVATILILATAALHVLYTLNSSALGAQVLGGVPATAEQQRFLDGMQIASFVTAIIALVGWSIWLSRAVTTMPALGLGYPAATGLTAFAENFLPGLNLLRVPALVRDVVRRIEPGQNRGEALIFAAWIGLLGGFIVPRVGAVLSGLSADSPESLLRSQLPILGVSAGLVLVGAIFLVALIWWIEARIARRREAQLAAIDAATAGATEEIAETTDEDAAIPYAAAPAETPASPSAPSWRDTSDSPLAATAEHPAALPGPGWDNEFAVATPASAAHEAAPARPVSQPAQAPEPAPPQPEPVVSSTPIETAQTVGEPEPIAAPEPEPQPVPKPAAVAPESAAVPPERSPVAAPTNGAPHLTIHIGNRGMLRAEMGGEVEPVMLEDLTAYGQALANVGGSADLLLEGNDGMVDLIARRARRILADAGIETPIPN
jgi:cytoskeletal protein RodZ